jgi:hypothetical protein
MAITDPGIVDLVATRPDSTEVRLIITDHLAWDDLSAHGRLLQDKINTYIAFVESGQLDATTEPAIPAGYRVCISLAVPERVPPIAQGLLEEIEAFLRGIGMRFEVKVRPPEVPRGPEINPA